MTKVKLKRDEIFCTKCGNIKKVNGNNFYKSYSPQHEATGMVNVCKPCVIELFEEFLNDRLNHRNAVIALCKRLDKPFIDEVYMDTKDKYVTNSSFIGNFFRLIHMKQWRKQGIFVFDDSIYDENNTKNSSGLNNTFQHMDNFKLTDEIIDKWGSGYSEEEYYYFEKKWKKLINNYGEKTSFHIEGLITYIRFRVKEELATAQGNVKEAKEWANMAKDSATAAKINVSQLSKSDISGGVDLLPQLFEAVESKVGIISIMPELKEQPYDDADLIIWAIVNYIRRLEDKPRVDYKDIWMFYDQMLEEFFKQKGYADDMIKKEKEKRNNIFRDLGQVYKEPIYEDGDL